MMIKKDENHTTVGRYRIFAGAFPGGALGERLQTLRLRYDVKTAGITGPHVTLAGTYWRSGPATVQNEAEAITALQKIEYLIAPFTLKLGGIATFLPHNPVIYLAVEATDELLAVRQSLLKALGQDKHHYFTPHLTLAMRLGRTQSQALLTQLQQSEWHSRRWQVVIDHLWLMQRGPDDTTWRYIHRIDLRR